VDTNSKLTNKTTGREADDLEHPISSPVICDGIGTSGVTLTDGNCGLWWEGFVNRYVL